jgi:phosphohistidine phosphatase
MDLILVRHAIAGERDSRRWPDDRERPLTKDGIARFEQAAAGLRNVVGSVDLVLASPYRRAWLTAEILEKVAGWPAPVACTELEPENRAETVIERCNQERAGVIALVGHEPLLGELAGRLLAGPDAPPQPLKKGGAACFRTNNDIVSEGDSTLRWWLPPKVLRRLGSS